MASTIVSWCLTLALVGAVIYYYKPELFSGLLAQPQPSQPRSVTPDAPPRPSNKRTKSKKSAVSKATEDDVSTNTSANETSSKKRKIASTPAPQPPQQTKSKRVEDEDDNDKEFAQQLAKAQTGTNLQKSGDQAALGKGRGAKKSKSKQAQTSDPSSEASSTVGRDVDDEVSTATFEKKDLAARAGDVSDMLEAPAPKPTTIRLTGIPDEFKPKKAAAKSFEPVLTKKQRQQQRNNEERRQLREESERIHEAKKQEQLRRARMAEGTSNQTRANNFGGSTSNAWQSKDKETVKAAPTNSAPLLDTFDPSSISKSKPNGAVHTTSLEHAPVDSAGDLKETIGQKTASAIAASTREGPSRSISSWSDEMYEEEQMKLLKQQEADGAWEDVTNKKTKRKTKKESDTASETSSSIHKSVPAAIKPSTNGVKTNGAAPRPETTNRFDSFQTNEKAILADADWEA